MNVGTKDDIASIPTVTAIGTAFGNEFFAAKTGGAISTITSFCMNPDSIDEHTDLRSQKLLVKSLCFPGDGIPAEKLLGPFTTRSPHFQGACRIGHEFIDS